MPRNSSGVYSLTNTNPVTPATTIATAWANPTLADIAQALTDSLDRQGRGGMLAPFRFADGTLAGPGAAFINEPGMGFWREGTGLFRFAINNQNMWRVDGSTGVSDFPAIPTVSGREVALKDAIVNGFASGWGFTQVSGSEFWWTKGAEAFKVELTFTGSLIDSILWSYSDDSGGTWAPLNTGGTASAVTSDADGFITDVDKDAGFWVFAIQANQRAFVASGQVQDNLDAHIAEVGTAVHGLGTMSTQDANNVNITGGSVAGIDVTLGNVIYKTQNLGPVTGAQNADGDTYACVHITKAAGANLIITPILSLAAGNTKEMTIVVTTEGTVGETVSLTGISWANGSSPGSLNSIPVRDIIYKVLRTASGLIAHCLTQ